MPSSCSTALGALIAVSISGKVKESILPGVAVGDELTVLAKVHVWKKKKAQVQSSVSNSKPLHVLVVSGHTVLRCFQHGADDGADPVAIAERAATSLLALHANFTSSSRRLLVLEGTMTAANQSCKQGKGGDFWAVSSQMSALLPTLVAVLAVKHQLVAIPRSNPNKTVALLGALSTSIIERDLLTQRATP